MTSSFFSKFFSTEGFMPHGHCYQWEPIPFWMTVGSDVLIAAAYFSIAGVLFIVNKRRKEIRFRRLLYMFAAFILLCGATHLMAVINMWNPFYRLDAALKLATGLVSSLTAVVLIIKFNDLLSLPTPSQYRQTQDKLYEQFTLKLKAEEANEAKSVFLSNMSHELRTPLTGIICALDILETSNLNEGSREVASIAQESSQQLLKLINGVLDLSKVEAGQLILSREPFSPAYSIHSVCEVLRLQAERKGVAFKVALDEATPTILLGDASRLNQVATNIIGNAVKFTQQGHVEVRLSLQVDDKDSVQVILTVEDTGPGIDRDSLGKIFDPFQQAATTRAEWEKGTGLGLAISREIIRKMGGEIDVRSQVGQGSCFDVRIPFSRATEAQERSFLESIDRESDLVLREQSASPLEILMVDDNLANRLIIQKILELRGHRVLTASSILEAMDRFTSQGFDLVIMDLRLGNESGLDCVRGFRQMESADQRTPIIVLSARSASESWETAKRAGFDAYLEKPIPAKQLVENVERIGKRT